MSTSSECVVLRSGDAEVDAALVSCRGRRPAGHTVTSSGIGFTHIAVSRNEEQTEDLEMRSALEKDRNSNKSKRRLTRRHFVVAVSAAVGAPLVVPSSVWSSNAPSSRINVALIGCGNQSRVDLPSMLRQGDVQVVAVCDVNQGSHGYARPEHFLGREPVQRKANDYYAGTATCATCWCATTWMPS